MESQPRRVETVSIQAPQETVAPTLFWRRLHRHMHGRYLLGVAIGMLAALGGAFAGYKDFMPSYRSTGILRITPLTLKILYAQTEVATPIFDSFVDVQINFMRSRPVVTAVLDNEKWLQAHPGQSSMEPEAFLRNLEITHQQRSELIEVSFTDGTPLGAKTGVSLLIESYMRINGDQSSNQRLQAMLEREIQLNKDMVGLGKQIGEITQRYGTDDLKQLHQAKVLELGRLEAMIMETEINVILSESALLRSDATGAMPLSEIATADEIIRRMLEEAQRTDEKLAELLLSRGKDHPDVVAVSTRLDSLKNAIKVRAEEFRKFHRSSFVNNVGVLEGVPTQASIDALKQRRDNLRGLYKTALQKSLEIGGRSLEIVNLQDEFKKTKYQLAENQAKVEQLRVDSSIVGQIMVISSGDLPRVPVKDLRRTAAAVGALVCFGLGFGLIAAWSFADRRLRRVADIATAGCDAPILGTFPRVRPALLSWTASALHETITRLQIDPQLSAIRVFAISSALPGEGKTEMAAALAVGFAALGKRTLLIDFDQSDSGLTHHLASAAAPVQHNQSSKGLLDVLLGEKLINCCQRTHLAGVSFLPMGGNAVGRFGSLTSAQIRAILAQAAAEYAIVLLDAPPILDGLESTLISKEAESLLLAVTPSTSDRELGRALALLRSANTSVGGLLFNQAAGADASTATLASAEDLRPFMPSPNGLFVEALTVPISATINEAHLIGS